MNVEFSTTKMVTFLPTLTIGKWGGGGGGGAQELGISKIVHLIVRLIKLGVK